MKRMSFLQASPFELPISLLVAVIGPREAQAERKSTDVRVRSESLITSFYLDKFLSVNELIS